MCLYEEKNSQGSVLKADHDLLLMSTILFSYWIYNLWSFNTLMSLLNVNAPMEMVSLIAGNRISFITSASCLVFLKKKSQLNT